MFDRSEVAAQAASGAVAVGVAVQVVVIDHFVKVVAAFG
jgi:hypothetical protein